METIHFNLGNRVQCDLCGKVIEPDDMKSGGILFMSNACCPYCVDNFEKGINADEQQHILGRCPKGKSFYNWIVDDIRGGEPAIRTIMYGDDILELLDNM